jgi:hypothetical protein
MSLLGVNSMAISAVNTVAKPTVGTQRQLDSSPAAASGARANSEVVEFGPKPTQRTAETGGDKSPQDAENIEKLKKASLQFESIFVRQLLRNAQFAPKGSHQGFGSMIVDAMADAITKGGGLGLSKQIEQMVAAADYDGRQAQSPKSDSTDGVD